MDKHKWIFIALIISWTLNVALGTALWLGANRGNREKRIIMHKEIRELPLPPLPEGSLKDLRMQAMPLHRAHRQLMSEMRELYLKNNLDTASFSSLCDSMSRVKGDLQKTVLVELARIHPSLNADQRQKFFSRTVERMHPGGMKGGRRSIPPPDCLIPPECPVPPCDPMEMPEGE